MTELTGPVGFGSPTSEKTFAKRRRAGVEMFATVGLAISLIIAATAVTIGIAPAQALQIGSNGTPTTVAWLVRTVTSGTIR